MDCQEPTEGRQGAPWYRSASRLVPFLLAALWALSANSQTESLKPFKEVAPLDGASDIVREVMGFELVHGPEGFVFGGFNLLHPDLPQRYATGLVSRHVDVKPVGGARLNCLDMACVEHALADDVEFMMPGGRAAEPERRATQVFLVSLDRQTLFETRFERARQIVYTTTGILYPPDRTSKTIQDVASGSPAHRAGLRAGHELTRVDDSYVNAESLAVRAMRGVPMQVFWRPDPGDYREVQGGLSPRTGALTVVDGIIRIDDNGQPDGGGLPAAFRHLTHESGMMALLQGKPEMAPEQERRVAALRVLEGWSQNPNARRCLSPPLRRIDIRTTIESSETNLAGQTRQTFSGSSVDPLYVEQQLVPFVMSMQSSWSSPETISAMEAAAGRLVQLEGCDGAHVRRLRYEIAKLAGLDVSKFQLNAATGGFAPDWRSFLAQCYPAYMQQARSEGRNVPDRGAVAFCACLEYGAADYGDPEIYKRYRAWSFDGIPQETMEEIWARVLNGGCNRGGNPVDPGLVQRYETFLRDNGL